MPDWLAYALPVVGIAAVIAAGVAVLQSRRRELAAVTAAEDARSIKNDFVAMVSHELRTPLTSIAGFADTLTQHWRELPAEEVDEFLHLIHREGLYLGDLVEDVLVIPRLEAGRLRFQPVRFDLGKTVHEAAVVLFGPTLDDSTVVSMPTGVFIEADPKRVQQVIRNLMENARKYGGDKILIEGVGYGDHYVVVVADNGPGVPDPSIEKIFEDFEQLSKGEARSASGIGLGLPIARRLARAMGGDVWYERRFPTGSRFCFSLPMRAGERQPDGSVLALPETGDRPRPGASGSGE